MEMKEVKVAKEVKEVMDLVVAVAGHFKAKKGVAEATELLDELMAAIGGIDKVDDEWKADKEAVLNAVLLGSSELVAALLEKSEEPAE